MASALVTLFSIIASVLILWKSRLKRDSEGRRIEIPEEIPLKTNKYYKSTERLNCRSLHIMSFPFEIPKMMAPSTWKIFTSHIHNEKFPEFRSNILI